jgi:hypothetical protein
MSEVRAPAHIGTAAFRKIWLWIPLFAFLLLAKLCHFNILWAEEGYGSAAAVQILHGKMLYRDFWFDKPPLAALVYVLWQGRPGFGLRLADAVYAFACAVAAFRLACRFWSEREGIWAACLTAFFLVFDIPASATTLGPDLLLVLPTLAAIDCCARKRPFWAGIWCAIGLAANAKAFLILGVCLAWCWPTVAPLALGFVTGTAPWLAWLALFHALPDYWQQVWWFGSRYSQDTFVVHPWREGLVRTLHWAGFHAAILLGAAACFYSRRLARISHEPSAETSLGAAGTSARATSSPDTLSRPAGGADPRSAASRLFGTHRPIDACERSALDTSTRWFCWLAAGLIGAVAGERFFPRYYFLLLPPVLVLAAGGVTLAKQRWRAAFLLLLLIPLVRFGPRYVLLAADALERRTTEWSDVQLDEDSIEAAQIVKAHAQPGDTLLVWGYRPDIFAYTQLPVAGRFLDSQLWTGVLADRHLVSSRATFPEMARENRLQLKNSRPAWIVDGLGLLNPELAITAYPELRPWLEDNYTRFGETRNSIIYRLDPIEGSAISGSRPSPYRNSPASIRIGRIFSFKGNGHVAYGVNMQGGL